MNWMSILGLCLIVLGTVFSFFGTYSSDKEGQEELTTKIQEKNKTIDEINANNIKLIDQNSSLLSSNNDVSKTNNELIGQNSDMLTKISIYQKDIEERNERIEILQNEINNVKDYGYYSTLDIYGRSFVPGVGIKFSSDLSDRMTKILIVVDGKIYVKNDIDNLPIIEKIIEDYPNFPFGYYAMFNVLKANGDENWKAFARKGVEIFEITTSIKGHSTSHDQALAVLNRELATNR